MRIASLLTLSLVAACFPDRLTSPRAASTLTPVPIPRPVAATIPGTHPHIYACPGSSRTFPYLMIIDGVRRRFPEDSAWINGWPQQLKASDVVSLQVFSATIASRLYGSQGRAAIVIETKAATK